MTTNTIAMLTALLAMPAIALSQSLPSRTLPATSTWTGAYVGVQLAYGEGAIGRRDPHGVYGGLHLGYDHDFGALVLGAELAFNPADISSVGNRTYDRLGHAKLRAGYGFGDVLAYATAGGAYTFVDLGPGPNEHDLGYVIGAGLEYRYSRTITIGAEYLFHDFGRIGDEDVRINLHAVQARMSYRF